jgi:hypothetical protein
MTSLNIVCFLSKVPQERGLAPTRERTGQSQFLGTRSSVIDESSKNGKDLGLCAKRPER